MKKAVSLFLSLLLILSTLVGCGQFGEPFSTDSAGPSGTAVQEPSSAGNETEPPAEPSAENTEGASLTTNGGAVIPLSSLEHRTDSEDAPVVYYISDITPEALIAAYDALGWTPEGKVAVKLSTGEPPASNYLRPELIKDLVQAVDGTIVECNTAYGGSVPAPPCTIRWRRITVLPPSRMFRFWTRTVLCLSR